MAKLPIDIFGADLLANLGDGPRIPYYHTPGKLPKEYETKDYTALCYRGTENSKPNYVSEIDITIDVFLEDQSILYDLEKPEEEREIFRIQTKYLWIIDKDFELRFLPETTQNPEGDRGYICHTNITAGGPARHGGELWFGKGKMIFINNSSGRFYTNDLEEWDAVIKIFKKAGYSHIVDIDPFKTEIGEHRITD